eukprot:GFUD01012828.1.p1 GENE.GFUD01012828.1~~GFUD01012828.1.p1  ORF type:complete len:111 (-),score=3.03 GFUD01012828.1:202-534(-)
MCKLFRKVAGTLWVRSSPSQHLTWSHPIHYIIAQYVDTPVITPVYQTLEGTLNFHVIIVQCVGKIPKKNYSHPRSPTQVACGANFTNRPKLVAASPNLCVTIDFSLTPHH